MFICLDISRNVVGLFAVECIEDAFVVDTNEIDENTSRIPPIKKSVKVICGINRIWIHTDHPKKSIAKVLFEITKNYFTVVIEKNEEGNETKRVMNVNEIALAQPTKEDLLLMKQLTSSNLVNIFS